MFTKFCSLRSLACQFSPKRTKMSKDYPICLFFPVIFIFLQSHAINKSSTDWDYHLSKVLFFSTNWCLHFVSRHHTQYRKLVWSSEANKLQPIMTFVMFLLRAGYVLCLWSCLKRRQVGRPLPDIWHRAPSRLQYKPFLLVTNTRLNIILPLICLTWHYRGSGLTNWLYYPFRSSFDSGFWAHFYTSLTWELQIKKLRVIWRLVFSIKTFSARL